MKTNPATPFHPFATRRGNPAPHPKPVTSALKTARSGKIGLALMGLFVFHLGPVLHGQTVWNIPGAGNWNTAGNWNPAVIPNSATTDVAINNGTSSVTLDISPAVRDLNMAAGNMLLFANQQDLSVNGNVVNHGVFFVNQTSSTGSTQFIAAANVALSGTGMIRLTRRSSSGNSRIDSTVGFSLTQQAGHTITGAGIVGASLINFGLVQADVSLATTGNAILLDGNPKTNRGLFKAAANSVLQIDATTIDNAGGLIRAQADSVVTLTNAVTITGGTIETVGTGIIQTASSLNAVFQDLTLNAHVTTTSRGDIGFIGAIHNTGLIDVNPGNATSDTLLEILGSGATLTGGGTISLLGSNGASLTGAGGVLTIANQTFQGSGDFGRGAISIDNQANGLIHANTTGQALTIDANLGGFTNTGTLRASNGGSMVINDTFTNAGLIDAQSLVDANGTLTNAVSGVVRGGGELEVNTQFINHGLIAPGGPVGRLCIDLGAVGLATFSATSVVEIDLAGTSSFDFLEINGNASLGGTLRVTLRNGFVPASTDVFYVLRAGNDTAPSLGVFANVGSGGILRTAEDEGFFTVIYTSNGSLSDVRLANFTPIVKPKLKVERSLVGNSAELTVKAKPNQTVKLMANLDLKNNAGWQELTTLVADANGDASHVDNAILTTEPAKYYRLEFNILD